MHYRIATVTDYPKIVEYLNGLDYFMPVDPAAIAGTWLVAVDAIGAVRGTIWFFYSGPNAFIDYWAGTSGMVAARLGALAEKLLAAAGVEYVRATISTHQRGAQRLAGRLGMIISSEDYKLAFRRIYGQH